MDEWVDEWIGGWKEGRWMSIYALVGGWVVDE
jgi:hypothetical protein